MKLAWHFSKVNPRFKNREATQGEFFASDTQIRAFIREAVQNSLDARQPGLRGPVSVRIFVSGDDAAIPPDDAKRYFRGGWDHFLASDSGLKDAPGRDERCRFIAFEDFGTTGLTGDVEQYHEIPGVRNPFYYFFRAEGQSNKLETGRGRWGLGKFVFPRSSRIRSFFAVTVRHDDQKRYLVGQSILRSHHVEDRNYTPDGWFGEKPEKDEAAAPVRDQEFISGFEKDFCLERRRQPGLSIVVPFCDASWTASAIMETVLQDYFYVILREELVVTIEDADSQLVLNATTIRSVVDSSEDSLRTTVGPLLDLTEWGFETQRSGSLMPMSVETSKGTLRWSRRTVSASEFSDVRRQLLAERRVAVRVPLEIHHRGGTVRSGHFDIYLQEDSESAQKRPVFMRDGILIADVRTRLIRDVRCLVTIDHPAVTEFLGDAENPAHTEWSEETSHFRGKYVNGAATLRFVRNSAADLWQLLSEGTEDDDQEVLVDVFSVGTDGHQPGLPVEFSSSTTGAAPAARSRLKSLPAKRRSSRPWRITRRAGGFRLCGTGREIAESAAIVVRVAYDRRGGNPLRKFSETDFQIGKGGVRVDVRGAVIQITAPNEITVIPSSPDFELAVLGFDANRDLYVQAGIQKSNPTADPQSQQVHAE